VTCHAPLLTRTPAESQTRAYTLLNRDSVDFRFSPWGRTLFMDITWQDPATGALGYVVIDTLVRGTASGGLRMRKGCTLDEVRGLAQGMTRKEAIHLREGRALRARRRCQRRHRLRSPRRLAPKMSSNDSSSPWSTRSCALLLGTRRGPRSPAEATSTRSSTVVASVRRTHRSRQTPRPTPQPPRRAVDDAPSPPSSTASHKTNSSADSAWPPR
jgi:hypothetical protein